MTTGTVTASARPGGSANGRRGSGTRQNPGPRSRALRRGQHSGGVNPRRFSCGNPAREDRHPENSSRRHDERSGVGSGDAPVFQGSRGLYQYLQGVQGYLAPPIFTVFVLGILTRRLNARGCLAALVVGFVLGAFRLAVDTPVSMGMAGFEGGYAPGSFLRIVNKIYFQYYSLFIFAVSVVVMVAVSYLTAPPSCERISGPTYATATDEHRAQSRASWDRRDVPGSALVLVMILMAYRYFRG